MKYMVIGGCGFIGSNIVKRIFSDEKKSDIYIYDNLSSGRLEYLDGIENNANVHVINDDIKNIDNLNLALDGIDIVYSVASNPDIAKAVIHPDIDFWEGTYLMNNVLEAMRRNNVKKLIYASGSGVYGDVGATVTDEDFSPMLPTSTYGASKLACEALISSYCHMFNMNASTFRFANVVGPNQTHGVGYDFIHKLLDNPNELQILGDGLQSKSYIYIDDIVDAIRLVEKNCLCGYNYYNVATLDHITVNEIADETVKIMGLNNVKYMYTGGDRGWKGDVPVVRLDSRKIRNLGWENKYSTKEAIAMSISEMYRRITSKRF